jgi:hypothetical protein
MNSFWGRLTQAAWMRMPYWALVGMMCFLKASTQESIMPRLIV